MKAFSKGLFAEQVVGGGVGVGEETRWRTFCGLKGTNPTPFQLLAN